MITYAIKKDKAVMTIWNQWESFLILFLAIQIILGKMFYIKYQNRMEREKRNESFVRRIRYLNSPVLNTVDIHLAQ
mgnify:CR=1 FL=1